MKKLTNKRGISLIVLVITIIVMIILASAIILSLSNSGIIGKANDAKTKSDLANKKEVANLLLAEYELGVQLGDIDSTVKTASDYVKDGLVAQKIDPSNVAVNGKEVVVGSGASAINKGVTIGDYVDYTPTVATSSFKTYEEDAFTTETILRWRYIGVDKNGNALLVSDRQTSDYYLLLGWLNGPTNLNTICKEIYSGKLGEARSINVEDVNMVLGANPVGGYKSSEGEYVENPLGLTIGEIIAKKGEPALNWTETPDGSDINEWVSDYYKYKGTTYKAEGTPEHDLIFKNKVIGEDGTTSESDADYWLASSCVYAQFDLNYTEFEIRRVYGGNVTYCTLFYADGDPTMETNYSAVRPVISLNSNVLFGTKNADGVWSIS